MLPDFSTKCNFVALSGLHQAQVIVLALNSFW